MWRSLIRDVQDFPQAGIVFKDITPLLGDPEGLRLCVDALVAPCRRRPCPGDARRRDPSRVIRDPLR